MSNWRTRTVFSAFPSLLGACGTWGSLLLLSLPGISQVGGRQTATWKTLIEQKAYSRAGKTLALHGRLSGNGLRLLLSLDEQGFQQFYSAFVRTSAGKAGKGERLNSLLKGLQLRIKKEILASLQTLSPLMDDRAWMVPLAGVLGEMAIQLSRRGNPAGLPILRKMAVLWRGQAFASANLGLALRLLGRYREAEVQYQRAAKEGGRAPWILNNWGLLKDAIGDREKALALFLEGARLGLEDPRLKSPGDAATCQTNAAVLLEKRGWAGDLARAVALLKKATTLAPDRVRPRYYLHIFQMELSGARQ